MLHMSKSSFFVLIPYLVHYIFFWFLDPFNSLNFLYHDELWLLIVLIYGGGTKFSEAARLI